MYNCFRYYDPEQGNYISQDPIGLAGGSPTLYRDVGDSRGVGGQRMKLETGIMGLGKTVGYAGINVVRALKEEAEKAASQTIIEKLT